ncbi:substrate-binding domain-containing protein [Demequina sp. TTPB684]|uniref:multiple monosaccharide ABC transporter substrate-binding protein n=1 Tax=unclassified Demequina TaxID=2620311 RepID=UPI001CF36D82|nr:MULTISPECIES: multiple monosaccharide ABC transporter substrate-binding protein [unclassified Demequina]MCB2413282.1 substrate-binding domain-containing protein [Demequina sp. TTPB684]UPU88742.1 substrate-binding domain-containing protein [Demequina sp. TMPB413]
MKRRNKLALVAGISAMALSLAACSSDEETPATNTGGDDTAVASEDCNVGIAMPTRSLERWINDGEGLKSRLEADGCTVDLQYADNETDQQISQLQNMIANGSNILVIAAIDGTTLGPVLETAGEAGATVIAYDRLILESENVDYYATFDNYSVGTLQGQFIESELGLADGEGPYNFEPFAGSPDDNNARFFFAGAWDVLSPYVESGQLVVPSGKAPATVDDWQSIGILGWGSDDAQAEMDNRLSSFYAGGEKVDVVLSPNDSLAQGISQSLQLAGYTADDFPLLTGQDGDKASVANILNGVQSMTVWKDTRLLGERVEMMVKSILAGEEPEVNDTETYDNGVKVVPSYLITPEVVTADTVQSKLIDSGFLKAEDVGL